MALKHLYTLFTRSYADHVRDLSSISVSRNDDDLIPIDDRIKSADKVFRFSIINSLTFFYTNPNETPNAAKGLILIDYLDRWHVKNWEYIGNKSLDEDQIEQINLISRCVDFVVKNMIKKLHSYITKNHNLFSIRSVSHDLLNPWWWLLGLNIMVVRE